MQVKVKTYQFNKWSLCTYKGSKSNGKQLRSQDFFDGMYWMSLLAYV